MMFQKKYRKPGKKRKAIRACLLLWAKIIKLCGECELCGATHLQLHAHHIVKKGWSFCAGWFHLGNGISLCYKCHQKVHDVNFNVQQEYHEKILKYLSVKNIIYEVLVMQCKSMKVDLDLTKIALKEELKLAQKKG